MNQKNVQLKALPRQIASRIASLRRRLSLWVLIRGTSRWLLFALIILAADMVLDRAFKMDFAQRAIMLVVIGLAVVGVFLRQIILPLMQRVTDDALLHEVELQHPELRENLISGAQLSRQSEQLAGKGVSLELAGATIDKSIELAKQLDFSDTLNSKKFFKNLCLLTTGVILVGGLAWGIQSNSFLKTWFNRNVLLGNAQWPQATYLTIVGAENGVLVLPRGGDHPLIVEVTDDSSVKDVEVSVEITSGDVQTVHSMKQTGELDGRQHLFVMHNVTGNLELQARGGDDVTETVAVKLVEPPSIVGLEMYAVYPDYTGVANRRLDGPGPHSLLIGSRIEAVANVNKSLDKFAVKFGETRFPLQPSSNVLEYTLAIPAADHPDAELAGGRYEFQLVDESGLGAIRPGKFEITMKADAAPKVRAKILGISRLAVPRARVPISYNVADDYGVSSIQFHNNWRFADSSGSDENQGSRDLSIVELSKDARPITQAQDVSVLNLEDFGLEPGADFRTLVRAFDNKPNEPNKADSNEFLIRIVTEEELRADLLSREVEQRKAFQQAYDSQLNLTTDLQALAGKSPSGAQSPEQFESERQREMISLIRNQKLVGTNLDAIANRFEEFLVEVDNNRLDENLPQEQVSLTLTQRFENIIEPIRQLDQELIALASRQLDECRRLIDGEEDWLAAVDRTTALHQQILEEMQRIMSAMAESESFQEVVNTLLQIKGGQDRINAELKKRKPTQAEVFDEEEVFDDG